MTTIKGRMMCKHFNGFNNENCSAGVKYPDNNREQCRCRQDTSPVEVTCPRAQHRNPEEISKEKKFYEEIFEKISKARNAIKEATSGKPGHGEIVCPICGGTLKYIVSPNRHIHGSCSNRECVSWMQ